MKTVEGETCGALWICGNSVVCRKEGLRQE